MGSTVNILPPTRTPHRACGLAFLVVACLVASSSAAVLHEHREDGHAGALESPASAGPPQGADAGEEEAWADGGGEALPDETRSLLARVGDSFRALVHGNLSLVEAKSHPDPVHFHNRNATQTKGLRHGKHKPIHRVDKRTLWADNRTEDPDSYSKNFAVDHPHTTDDVGTVNFFASASWKQWVVFIVVCIILLGVDSTVFSKSPQTFKWHVGVIIGWIIIAVCYDMWIEGSLGNRRAFEWIYGYMLEWMLSMDNLFVFHLIFKMYKTPPSQTRKGVFVGILCAVVFRLVFFLVVATLLHAFGWVRWPVGAALIYSGIGSVWDDDDDDCELQDTRTVRLLRSCLGGRLKDDYAEQPDLITYDEQGKWQISMLFVVVVMIELSDVIFALDSVSAKTAQIPDQYIAFSSSILAMYGLRAMYFVIEDLVTMFDLLKYGLAVILVYIGVELMFANFFHLSKALTCICIIAIFFICITGSIAQKRWQERRLLAKEAAAAKA